MSVRAVWILAPPSCTGTPTVDVPSVVYSRRYPTVEWRARCLYDRDYVGTPDDRELAKAVSHGLGLNHPAGEFVQHRDSCKRGVTRPIYDITVPSGSLWPVVAVHRNGYLICTLPLVETGLTPGDGDSRSLITASSVAVAFDLVMCLADIMSNCPIGMQLTFKHPTIRELNDFMMLSLPLGTPTYLNIATVRALTSQPTVTKTTVSNSRPQTPARPQTPSMGQLLAVSVSQPAWNPCPYKGVNKLCVMVREVVRVVQYDRADARDTWNIYGTITVTPEIEGATPQLSMVVRSHPRTPVGGVIIHPYTQDIDGVMVDGGGGESSSDRFTLLYNAPPQTFTLCQYEVKGATIPPVKALYSMKEVDRSTVSFTVVVQLTDGQWNSFEFCDVNVPFYNRGLIQKVMKIAPSAGDVSVAADKRTIVWKIGQRFASRDLKVKLSATVSFTRPLNPLPLYDDPFCVEQNSYILIMFKIPELTLSGCNIDLKSVQVMGGGKGVKSSVLRETVTGEYKVWNKFGNVLTVYDPTVDECFNTK